MSSIISLVVLLALGLVTVVNAHSWVQCVDYTEENGVFWDANKCRAWPRNYDNIYKYGGYAFGGDMGMDYKPSSDNGRPCKAAWKSTDYTAAYPKAKYHAGQRVCLAWPPKNHVAANCNNPHIPDNGLKLYRTGKNPTSDPGTLAEFHTNLVHDFGTTQGTNGVGFQNCPNFCAKPGDALCTGCFTMPNLETGSYTFLWEWAFNDVNDIYANCFDVEIVANSGNAITSTLPFTTADQYKAGTTAAVSSGTATVSPTTRPTSGGATSPPATSPPATSPPATSPPSGATGAPLPTTFNGNFNEYNTNTDFDTWSWGNQGTWPYQTYIYGNADTSNKMSTFVALSSDYKAPIDSSAKRGIRVEINGNSKWNGQNMLRTELVAKLPETTFSGKKYFHFSLSQGSSGQLNAEYEHQIMFWESHFSDIKFGGSFGNKLNFVLSNGQSVWSTEFGTNVWHNFAIETDYSANQVSLHYSTGTNPLTRVVPLTSSSVSRSEWHIGVLRLPKNNNQDPASTYLQISSVYVSSSLLSFTPGGSSAGSGSGSSSAASSSSSSSSTTGTSPSYTTAATAPTTPPSYTTAPTTPPSYTTAPTIPSYSSGDAAGSTSSTVTGSASTSCVAALAGTERCQCTNGGACDPGLVCASGVCVAVPPSILRAAGSVAVPSFLLLLLFVSTLFVVQLL